MANISPVGYTDGDQFAHAAIIVDTVVGAKPTPPMANISPVGYTHGDQFAHATIIVGAIVGAKPTPFMANISPVGYTTDGEYFARGTTPMATNSPMP